MSNPFAGRTGLSGPVNGLLAVTPSDSADLEHVGVGLFTPGGGDIAFVDDAGNTHTLTFPAWSSLQLGVRRVLATGTTASAVYVGVMT